MKIFYPTIPALLAVVILAGCKSGEDTFEERSGAIRLDGEALEAAIAYRNEEAQAYYQDHPDFFRTADIADLPADLNWENGMDQEEFASPKAIRGGVERIAMADYPRTLRVVGPDSATSFRSFIHDDHSIPLVKKHPETGGYFPGLAKEWAFSEDRKTVFFRIDPDARFSDGVPVLAHQFHFTVYFMRNPWIQAPWYNNWYSEKYTHITIYDDRTIAVGLDVSKPDPLRFFEEDLYPIPEHFYDEFGEDYVARYTWRFEPTTGPYVIRPEDLRKGRTLIQTRQDDWWAGEKKFWRYRFNPDQHHFTVVRDPDKAIEAFLSGDYEMLRIRTPEVWEDKLDKPPVNNGYIVRARFYNQTPRPCYSLRLNKHKEKLKDLNVRLGLQHASNFEKVIDTFFRGQYQRMNTSSDGYGDFTNPDIKAYPFSPEKARKYFADAGYKESGPDGILQNEKGERLSFTVTTGYKQLTDVLTILQQEARKAGVEFVLEVMEPTAAWKKVQEKKHEITLTALNRSVELYPRYWDFWHSYNAYKDDGSPKPETNNFTMTALPEFDSMVDKYEASTDLEEIRGLAFELEKKIHEDAAFIPGWVRPFFECAYWRWVQWPDEFNSRLAREHDELSVHWIDPEIQKETLEAQKSGKTFEKTILIFDQHKVE